MTRQSPSSYISAPKLTGRIRDLTWRSDTAGVNRWGDLWMSNPACMPLAWRRKQFKSRSASSIPSLVRGRKRSFSSMGRVGEHRFDRTPGRIFRRIERRFCGGPNEEGAECRYYSSRDGRMIYHCLSLLLLAYLVWRRPVAGMLIGILEGVWLLWPLYGLPEPVSFDVHLTLALTCLFAWRRDDPLHSVGLALAGMLVLGLLYHPPTGASGTPDAVLGGVLCGELIATAWLMGRLISRDPPRERPDRMPPSIRRVVRALGSLNAPLGTGGERQLHSDPHRSASIANGA